TIEGTHIIDAWIDEGNTGYSPREGFQTAMVWIGFVKEMNWGDPGSIPPAVPGGTISGTVKTLVEWTPPLNPLVLGDPVDRPYIALTNIGGNDEQVYLARGNPDGSFVINNVPDGVYQMAIWDEPLDYIISFRTVTIPEPACLADDPVNGSIVNHDCDNYTVNMNIDPLTGNDLGGFGIPRWFGWLSGYVFQDDGLDSNGNRIDGLTDPAPNLLADNGIRDCSDTNYPPDPATCEVGIGNIDLDTRFRDGSIQYTTFTESTGFYEFPEVFELEKFAVMEVGFGRFARTGIALHDELDPSIVTPLVSDLGGGLLAAELTWAAKRRIVDFGKRDYGPGENGGITGIVQYATTRNEFNARLAAAEDYEPGIPDVTVRLWGLGPDGEPNTADDVLLNEVQTDHFQHPTGCDVLDSSGNPLPDPLGLGPNCIEVPNISNEVKDGAFDGGYAFESYWAPSFGEQGAVEVQGLPPGDYVVEVVPPVGYQVVKEEDNNTAEGSNLVPQVPPPACVGDLHTVPDITPDYPGFPFAGQQMPLCDKRLVRLQEGQNAAADFFLFTTDEPYDPTIPGMGTSSWSSDQSVPIPGRIFGFALDDLNVETNPNFIYYGEKRGIPFTPVGIRDFTGRLITTVRSDENGIFEVLLPSSYMADCPIPSGVCPAMYRVVVNDPGDPDNPNPDWNPNYQTLTFVFDVWPGKTTYADVATFPITAFHRPDLPGSQLNQPALCVVPADTPQIFAVSKPYVVPPYGKNFGRFTITGQGFGTKKGKVTIDGVKVNVKSWSDTSITAEIPSAQWVADHNIAGPGQLLVTAKNGHVSPTGLTFHVIDGTTYNPTIVEVDPPVNPATDTPIQDAIDAASGPTLIVVKPGSYFLGPRAGAEGGGLNLNKSVKLQGYGPGDPTLGTGGSVLDQRFILTAIGINVDGTTAIGTPDEFNATFNPQIDGFRITAARDEQDVGGGIHVETNSPYLEISNNVIQSNGGNFGGGVVLGKPYQGDNFNDNIRIHHNRILNNGGFSLAGGVAIFNGADNYEIDHNEICGNYSGEYGGGISHFGLSDGGKIHHNRIYFNGAFDEGGGVMIAGEQPIANPENPNEPPPPLTNGSGAVEIYNNLITFNLANDDGGGIRLLQPRDYPITIINNIVANNVSTDLGGGIALDDASDVTIVNNTVARNASTATAEDSDGLAHAAGLSVELYSTAFTTYLDGLPGGSSAPGYPDPVLFNNIFCENKAYTWNPTTSELVFDSFFDLEVFAGGAGDVLHPTYSLLTDPSDTAQEDFLPDPTNKACGDLTQLFVDPIDTQLSGVAFRMEPTFVTVVIITVDVWDTTNPQNIVPVSLGNYHLFGPKHAANPARDAGTDPTIIPNFPRLPFGAKGELLPIDIDDNSRPQPKKKSPYDIGADESTKKEMKLFEGLNLISFPLALNGAPGSGPATFSHRGDGTTPAEVLASIDGKYERVYAFFGCDAADPWKLYDPNVPSTVNDLDAVNEAIGMWVVMTQSDTLVMTGVEPTTTTIPLCAGWNLVGYPASAAQPIDQVLAPIAPALVRVFNYDASDPADHWKMYDPNVPAFVSDLWTMEPGKGYWILVSQDTVLTIDNTVLP
ncbi:MAG: hypothetical protein D6791_14635, partial [Chloroflexi bacterium]